MKKNTCNKMKRNTTTNIDNLPTNEEVARMVGYANEPFDEFEPPELAPLIEPLTKLDCEELELMTELDDMLYPGRRRATTNMPRKHHKTCKKPH
jgi:hypothetical protein